MPIPLTLGNSHTGGEVRPRADGIFVGHTIPDPATFPTTSRMDCRTAGVQLSDTESEATIMSGTAHHEKD